VSASLWVVVVVGLLPLLLVVDLQVGEKVSLLVGLLVGLLLFVSL